MKSIPENVIKKALEGGWLKETGELPDGITDAQTVLQPEFWVCLGDALDLIQHYEDVPEHDESPACWCIPINKAESGNMLTIHRDRTWSGAAMEFFQAVLKGEDTDAYWADLLKSSTPTHGGK